MATDECGCVFGDGTLESPLVSCREPVGHGGEHRGRSLDGRYGARWPQAKQTDEREWTLQGFVSDLEVTGELVTLVSPHGLLVDRDEVVVVPKARAEAAEQRIRELERIARAVSGEPDNTPNPVERLAKNYQAARAESQRQWEARKRAEAKLVTAVEALRVAERGLMEARNGLDLGLGCARDVEDDRSIRAVKPRSRRQEAYLEDARGAHRNVRRALSEIEQGDAER